VTRSPDPVFGACRARPCSPRPRPPCSSQGQALGSIGSAGVARPCSPTSQLLWPGLTSHARASSVSVFRPSQCGPPDIERPAVRSPGSRARSVACAPGSQTTRSRRGTRADAPHRMAFRCRESVGTPDDECYVAQWLARTLPCQRFVPRLAVRHAWLGASGVRCSFTVRDLHPLLLAGLPTHPCCLPQRPVFLPSAPVRTAPRDRLIKADYSS